MAYYGMVESMRKYAGRVLDGVATAAGLNAKTAKLYAGLPSKREELLAALSAAQLKNILDSAAEGECQAQARFIGDMLEKDPLLMAHFETRRLAVLACDMMLIQSNAKGFQAATADDSRYKELWEILNNANIYGLVEHLLDAIPRGYAGAVIDWGKGGGTITRFRYIHPTNILFDEEGNPAIKTGTDIEGIALSSYHPNQFVMHYYKNQPEAPYRCGLGRCIAWPYFFKHHAMKSWVRFLEKFGIPFLMARISEADFANDALKRKLIDQLRNFATDGAVLTTSEGGVEAITIAGTHNRIHEEFVKTINQGFAITILGQLASSFGEPGRLGGSEAQENVRRDRIESDCLNLMHTINSQVIAPLWRFKHGSDKGCPLFLLNFIPPEDKERKANWIKTLADCDYRVNREQVGYEFNVQLEPATGKTKDKSKDNANGTDTQQSPDAK